MNDIHKLWNDFQSQRFPEGLGGEEIDGIDLAELDGVAAGCISTFNICNIESHRDFARYLGQDRG